VITNALVNRAGPWFVEEMREATGRAAADVARAWLVARDAFALPPLWAAIEAGDNRIAARTQTQMLRATARVAERAVPWILRQAGEKVDVAATAAALAPGLAELVRVLPEVLGEERAAALAERRSALEADGAPPELAATIAALGPMASGPDIVRLAQTALDGAGPAPVAAVARIYFAVGARLGLGWLRDAAGRIRAETNWQRLAVGAIVDDLFQQHAEIVRRALAAAGSVERVPAVAKQWSEQHRDGLARIDGLIEALKSAPSVDVAALAVAGRELRALTVG
jgi:glutamate dehydrogenase